MIGKYDADVAPKVLRVYDSTTRGNMFKLNKDRAKYDLRKFYFTNRVVNDLRLISRAGKEGSTVSSIICDRWLILS